ncbi:MAG: hypothetical protein WHT29_00825 [Bacteroidales bacterium]
MRRSENRIDRLFREKLSHYEAEVSPHVWEKITDRLAQKRRMRLLRIYLSFAASVALVISLGIGYYLGQSRASRVFSVTNSQQQHNAGLLSKTNTIEIAANAAKSEPSHPASHHLQGNKYEDQPSKPEDTLYFDTIPSTHPTVNSNPLPGYLASNPGMCRLENSNHQLKKMLSGDPIQAEIKRSVIDRVYLSFTATPLYSYRVVNGVQSATLDKFEKPAITFSAGMNAIITKGRLHLSLGTYFTQMALRIDNVMLRRNGLLSFDTYALEKNVQPATLLNSSGKIITDTHEWTVSNSEPFITAQYSDQTFLHNDDRELAQMNKNIELTSLTQKFNYLEIPLNFQYNIYQRQFLLGIQAGINANLLVSNATMAKVDGRQIRVGETTNLRAFNIVATCGLSVAIPITDRLSFLIEPRLRYYIFSVNRGVAIDTHPYTYGIYTGIMIRY